MIIALDIYYCIESVSILGGELVDAAIGRLDVQGHGNARGAKFSVMFEARSCSQILSQVMPSITHTQ